MTPTDAGERAARGGAADPGRGALARYGWRGVAVACCCAAACVPPAWVTQLLLLPVLPNRGAEDWRPLLWVVSLPATLMMAAFSAVLWAPASAAAAGGLWWSRRVVPRTWGRLPATAVLAAVGAALFVGAGLLRARVIVHATSHRGLGTSEWSEELTFVVLPLAVIGAAAGACLSRVPAPGAGARPAGRAG
ncbi:MAG TPA: hypothetical protein VGD56_04585 [Gemmatirosa sp.]